MHAQNPKTMNSVEEKVMCFVQFSEQQGPNKEEGQVDTNKDRVVVVLQLFMHLFTSLQTLLRR